MRAACDGSVAGLAVNEGRGAVVEAHPRDSGVNFEKISYREDFVELLFNAELFDCF